MVNVILSLVLPTGRISRLGYVVYAIPLALCAAGGWICYVRFQSGEWVGDTKQALAIILFFSWASFSLLSKRLQDFGCNGLYVLPVFALAMFWLLLKLDPMLFGDTPGSIQSSWGQIYQAADVSRMLMGFICLCAVLVGGHKGPNAFGAPFGSGEVVASTMKDAKMRARVMEEFPNSPGARMAARKAAGLPLTTERSSRSEASHDSGSSSKLGFPKPERVGFGR